MDNIKIFTIGFTKKNAETFFSKLRKAGVRKVIDIRLNNVSQLAGFAKRDDLKYFLNELCGCEYVHFPQLAPTKEILDGYKKKRINWVEYENQFIKLLKKRNYLKRKKVMRVNLVMIYWKNISMEKHGMYTEQLMHSSL